MTVQRVKLCMYNVGFGDAFVLSLEHDDGIWRMLIDCGVHTGGGSDHKMSEIVDQIITDVTPPDGGTPRLDVVVATHRHRDHVSGFDNVRWDEVEVGEVWLPFTENPADELGSQIRVQQSKKALALVGHLQRIAAAGAGATARAAAGAAKVAENSLTNAKAMDRLHNKFKGSAQRRYFPNPGVEPAAFAAPGLPSVRIHMLGPLRDKSVIALMDPPADQQWFGLATSGDDGPSEDIGPLFHREFALKPAAMSRTYHSLALTAAARHDLAQEAEFDAWAAATSITDAVNNTSLVFVVDIDGTRLVFPGDAQWGLWDAILRQPGTDALLSGTAVYKVGHHGSHNANHKRFVENLMGPDTVAMMSFHEVKDWPSIPNKNLVSSLSKRPRHLVRSDKTTRVPRVTRRGTLSSELTLDLT
ncbi:MAG TPA: hypothetical protein VFB78_19910 [Acidimicrobiales bacterium]|nr:hypothetical protein [Acidimicrobiales bacterium]